MAERLFLQSLISNPVRKEVEVNALCLGLLERNNLPTEIEQFFGRVNEQLEQVDMKLVRTIDPNTGEYYVVLVNLNGDEVAQLATQFSPAEISFFKLLVEEIVGNDFQISSISALQLCSSTKPSLSKKDAEAVLDRLVADRWIHESEGYYSLCVRTVAELQQYLREQYPDVMEDCSVCHNLVVSRQYSKCGSCSVKIHELCHAKLIHRRVKRCPSCKKEW
ncbi:hypothetical protein BJ742DRAFT_800110 [Cladochytrium replicatum]|nr:hypothetical protein BJ742DRAFT_800110 [Cladochytrium replicatum]